MLFDATTIAPAQAYDVLPAGDYPVMITASRELTTKDGRGKYTELTLEVQGGPYAGRRIWDRLNLDNPNPKAVEIAQRQLSAICHSVNVLQVRAWTDLHNRPLVAIVKVESNDRGMSNQVKGYKAANAAPAAMPAPAAPRAAAAPAMPWAAARA